MATGTLASSLLLASGGRGFDVTTLILVVLAAIAGYLVYEFIRESRGRSAAAIVGAVLGHLLLVLFLSSDIPGRLGCGVETDEPELIEFEVAQIEEPEPEPEPEVKEEEPPKQEEPPEEPPQEEPPKEVKPKQPPPKQTKKAKTAKPDEPVEPDPAPPKRWDMSQTTQGGNSGVVVEQGSGGEYGGQGKRDSKGSGKGKPGGGDPKGEKDGTESKWQPRSELFIKDMPKAVKVPKIECPASAELGVQGEVILKVQITRNGKVRSVKVVKGIGQGCDKVAVKALKQARFKPAVGTNGKPVDFELRWEYAFTVSD